MSLCALLLTLMDAISQGYAIGPIHASHWESRFHLPQPLGSALLPKSLQGRFPCENSEGPCAHEKVVWTGRIVEGRCWKHRASVMHHDIILRSPSSEAKRKLAQDDCRKIKKARQRLLLCRLMVDVMRTVHCTYAPASERFGTCLETFFIALCVAIGDIDGKPFCIAKIADYMRVPRTTVIRRLDQLQSWGLICRRGRYYYMHEKALNSVNGMRSYEKVRSILSEATEELTFLDALAD